jgi:hypothetical protein
MIHDVSHLNTSADIVLWQESKLAVVKILSAVNGAAIDRVWRSQMVQENRNFGNDLAKTVPIANKSLCEDCVPNVNATKASGSSPGVTAWMDSRTAAKYLGFDKTNAFKTLERYARESKLPGYFRFNRWYFLKEELDAWIKTGVSSNSQSVRVN